MKIFESELPTLGTKRHERSFKNCHGGFIHFMSEAFLNDFDDTLESLLETLCCMDHQNI